MAYNVWIGTDSGNEGDYSVGANWSLGAVPVATDDVVFDSTTTQAVTAGLDQSSVALGSLTIDGATYGIGTTAADLQVQTDEFYMRSGTGAIYLDFGSTTAVTATVDNATNLNIIAAHASGVLNQNGGTINIAVPRTKSATIATINKRAGTLNIGESVTLTTLNSDAGSTTLNSACTTINQLKGSVTTKGTAAITTVNVADSGTFYPDSNGTVTTVNLSNGGKLDASRSVEARTITTVNLNGPCQLKYDDSYVTITNRTISGSFALLRTLTIT